MVHGGAEAVGSALAAGRSGGSGKSPRIFPQGINKQVTLAVQAQPHCMGFFFLFA